jgi:hypothetical protein
MPIEKATFGWLFLLEALIAGVQWGALHKGKP